MLIKHATKIDSGDDQTSARAICKKEKVEFFGHARNVLLQKIFPTFQIKKIISTEGTLEKTINKIKGRPGRRQYHFSSFKRSTNDT